MLFPLALPMKVGFSSSVFGLLSFTCIPMMISPRAPTTWWCLHICISSLGTFLLSTKTYVHITPDSHCIDSHSPIEQKPGSQSQQFPVILPALRTWNFVKFAFWVVLAAFSLSCFYCHSLSSGQDYFKVFLRDLCFIQAPFQFYLLIRKVSDFLLLVFGGQQLCV